MAKYVPDILSRRWVIISSQRVGRPDNFDGGNAICPFCPGNEHTTGKVTVGYMPLGVEDPREWILRVIPNKYPITDYHEVVIHSRDHKSDIEDFPLSHVELLLKAYKDRYDYYRNKGQVLIFGNHGEHAGASIEHPHSQLVVIPFQINLDTLAREPLNNMVESTKHFNVYCPDFSQWPYEVWIAPKKENTVFGDITDHELSDLAVIMQQMIQRIKHIFDEHRVSHIPFGYNFYISPKENWYLRIIPRFVHRAGFELGTGLEVNVVDPSDAALELKGIDEKVVHVLSKLKINTDK